MAEDKNLSPIDFDAWTEEDEAKAIEAIAESSKIRYVISEGAFFHGRFPDGRVIKTPLKITVEMIELLEEKHDSEIEQIKMLLGLLGQSEDVKYLAESDLIAAIDYAAKYFRVFERIAQISMGEFAR